MVNRKFLFVFLASLINLSDKRNILNIESRNLLSHRKVACNFQGLYDSPELQPKSLYISRTVRYLYLVEQDTIKNVSAAYLNFIIIFLGNNYFFHLHSMQLFSVDATIFFKN